jgi:hypothetical protein
MSFGRFSKDFPLFRHNVWMMMKMSFPSAPIRRAHSAVYQEVILSFGRPLGSISSWLGGRSILTETCLFDDITTRRWTIDKSMDDYITSIRIESTYKDSFDLVKISFLGFSMASHPIRLSAVLKTVCPVSLTHDSA